MLRSSCIRRSAAGGAGGSSFNLKQGISTSAALMSIMGLWLSLTQIRTLNVELNDKKAQIFLLEDSVNTAEAKYKKDVQAIREKAKKDLKVVKDAAEAELKKETEMRMQIQEDLKKLEAEWKSLKKSSAASASTQKPTSSANASTSTPAPTEEKKNKKN